EYSLKNQNKLFTFAANCIKSEREKIINRACPLAILQAGNLSQFFILHAVHTHGHSSFFILNS
ncbi:MAG: hypothetical protein IJE56_04355, partial [Clostridia bacterium]|nr:hypothetical protein [Clostridia bacterium]